MRKQTETPDEPVKSGTSTNFRLAEKREDGTVVLEVGDGRMFVATVDEGVEVLKSATLTVKHDGIVGGVPVNPVVTKADR